MSKIILTKEEKECLETFVDAKSIADMAFYKASRMCLRADDDLWKKVKGIYPDALSLHHPPEDDWVLTVCEKPSKDTSGGDDNDSI